MNPRFSPNRTRRIELLAFPRIQILDVTGPLQVFVTANELAAGGAGADAGAGGRPPYDVRVVSPGGGAVASSAGVALLTAKLPGKLPGKLLAKRPGRDEAGGAPDTLIVAGGPGVDAACGDAALVGWVRGRAQAARRFASVCTGALLLASAGLLEGRRAATHWSVCGELARRFPGVIVEPDRIFVRDGPAWTSAGVTAGIDLALALVEEDLGRATALAVARYLVVFLKRPGGQAQFSVALDLQRADRFEALHAWIEANLAGDLSLPVLARQAGMSGRSFSRHYAAATGQSPARAVERLRVEAACLLLADGTMPVKRIARRCGYGSEETMRRSFARLLSTTPGDFRARFGGAGPA